VIADRAPSMGLYPDDLPWLSKPDALRAVWQAVAAASAQELGLAGYLDTAEGDGWFTPRPRARFAEIDARTHAAAFDADPGGLEAAFEHLGRSRRSLPAGTFVFVCSDFLAPPNATTWLRALGVRWDPVPVVVQDPVWEQSFPPVGSVVVPVLDPGSGRMKLLRLSKREASERRRRNEERIEALLRRFTAYGLEPVRLSTTDPDEIFRAFLSWAEQRMYGVGVRLN
jgi:hypothetical protein